MKQVDKLSLDSFSFEKLANSIVNVQKTLMSQAVHAVNLFLTSRNWIVGLYIVEYEQHGSDRAQYGDALLKRLAKRINMRGFGERRLYEFRQMYMVYPNLGGEIVSYLQHNNCEEILRLPTAIFPKLMQPDDNPPVGLLLCTDYGETTVRYATEGLSQNLFVSKYKLQLPSECEIKDFLVKYISEK